MRARLLVLTAASLLLPMAAARADCDANRLLDKVTQHGAVVQLDNGSQWSVADLDRSTAEQWKQDAPVTACPDELINREDHESVRARRTDSSNF
jgi:hypothetical protein